MKILSWLENTNQNPQRHKLLVFGLGLVGKSIEAVLTRRREVHSRNLEFNWQSKSEQVAQLSLLKDEILRSAYAAPVASTSILWTAGAAGFSSDQATLRPELESFELVTAFTRELAKKLPPESGTGFHFVSSAGGLFEGIRNVDRDTQPCPKRPYGELKLKQERLLLELPHSVHKIIYRPSSVYGFEEFGRIGLIAALIRNSIRCRTTNLFGRLTTLRDYVLAEDIGRYVASMILSNPKGEEKFILASGKATSMMEIVNIVADVMAKPSYFQIDTTPSNAAHNTFLKSCSPSDLQITDLRSGIVSTQRKIATSMFYSPHASAA